jgi:hypothetical protein
MNADFALHSRPNMREGMDPLPGHTPPEGLRTLKLWGGDEFSFADLLDFINPLQHIPIISSIYRELTGDKIGAVAQLTVGGLVGGPLGFIGSVLAVGVQTETGKSVEQFALSVLDGSSSDPSSGGALVARMGEDRRDPFATPIDEAPTLARVESGTAPALAARMGEDKRDPFAAPLGEPAALARAEARTAPALAAMSASEGLAAHVNPAAAQPAMAQPVALRPAAKRLDTNLQNQAAVPPSARMPSMPRGVTPTVGRVDPTAALLAAQSKGGPWLPQSMSQALDKYEALARQRTETTKQIDQSN